MKFHQRLMLAACAAAMAVAACLYINSGGSLSRIAPAGANAFIQELIARQDYCSRWFKSASSKKPVGVALIVHGLNIRPEMMEPIIVILNSAGIEALNVSLRGHGANFTRRGSTPADDKRDRLESFKRVSYVIWLNEVHQAYMQAMLRARKLGVPLFFVGYSLGGLLGCDLLAANPGVHFDRMALFAPALTLRPGIAYQLKPLQPFPEFVIDSDAPESNRANDGTPVAGYTALLEAVRNFEANLGPRLNVPTLIFMDQEDEFVSFENLQEFVSHNGFDRWDLVRVAKDNAADAAIARHMIINEQSVGAAAWAGMVRAIKAHFMPQSTVLKAAPKIRQQPGSP
jgi:alpha-beta hydrolase superfamily lysophospholipase